MSSFNDGFLWVIGAFVAIIIICCILGALFFYALKTGMVHQAASATIKNIIGY